MGESLIDLRDVRLRVSDDEWVARQSGLGQLDICGLRFQFDREAGAAKQYHTGSARAIGTAYHAAVEALYNEFHEDPIGVGHENLGALAAVIDDAYMDEVERAGDRFHLDEGEDHATNRVKARDMLLSYVEGGHYLPADEWELIGTEVTFWDEVGVQKVKGTIDSLFRNRSTGTYRIEDHKTAGRMWPKLKESPRKNVQAPFYFAFFVPAWCEANGVALDYNQWEWTYGVMTYAGKFARRIGTPRQWHLDLVTWKLQKAQATVEQRLYWPNPSSNLCSAKYCDHWDVCPFGAAAT